MIDPDPIPLRIIADRLEESGHPGEAASVRVLEWLIETGGESLFDGLLVADNVLRDMGEKEMSDAINRAWSTPKIHDWHERAVNGRNDGEIEERIERRVAEREIETGREHSREIERLQDRIDALQRNRTTTAKWTIDDDGWE